MHTAFLSYGFIAVIKHHYKSNLGRKVLFHLIAVLHQMAFWPDILVHAEIPASGGWSKRAPMSLRLA